MHCLNSAWEDELAFQLHHLRGRDAMGLPDLQKRCKQYRPATITGKQELIRPSLSELEIPSWTDLVSGSTYSVGSFGLVRLVWFFCLSKSPSPFPGHVKHLWHSFTPGPLRHLSPLHLSPEAWPPEPSKHQSIFFFLPLNWIVQTLSFPEGIPSCWDHWSLEKWGPRTVSYLALSYKASTIQGRFSLSKLNRWEKDAVSKSCANHIAQSNG